MRLSSGTIDQFIYFVALDSADFTTRETGFSSFTVYSSLNGGAVNTFTTPTINETGSGTMVGVYELLVDENVTITSGNDEEELCIHITHAGMAPVTRTITIYRPKFTEGSTQTNDFDAANDDVAVVTLVGTTTTNTDMVGTDSAALATALTTVDNEIATMQGNVTDILTDTANLNDTGITELTQAQPDATPTLRNAVMLLYMALAQRLDVPSTGTPAIEIHDSSGTRIALKAITDSGGDYSEARMITGAA